MSEIDYSLRPVGWIRSAIQNRSEAPKQGNEGAPDAWLEIDPQVSDGLHGIEEGHELIVITWLHQALRDVLKVRPRRDPRRPLTGVFATRSPDRPNPLGVHQVTVRSMGENRLLVGPIEAIEERPLLILSR
jgi:tRNA-Thr(GGU) m(6)t(6)A37 methyltransferase TsaA